MTRVLANLFAASLAAAVLSGCGTSATSTPENCPSAVAIVPTSALTTFQPGMESDPKGEVYHVGISGVTTDCSLDTDNGITDSSLAIDFRATRKVAGPEASYRVPYYVAVVQGGRVLDKRDFWVQFTFPAGATQTDFSDQVASTKIVLDNGKKPYDYQIVAGFQLTRSQLEYNKTTSRYGP